MIKFKYEKATDTLPINGVLACAINGLLEKDLFKKLIEKSSLEYTEQEVNKSYIYRISVTTSKDLEKTYSLVHSFGLYLGEFNTLRMWNNLIKEFKVTIRKTVEYTTYLTLNHLQDATGKTGEYEIFVPVSLATAEQVSAFSAKGWTLTGKSNDESEA